MSSHEQHDLNYKIRRDRKPDHFLPDRLRRERQPEGEEYPGEGQRPLGTGPGKFSAQAGMSLGSAPAYMAKYREGEGQRGDPEGIIEEVEPVDHEKEAGRWPGLL